MGLGLSAWLIARVGVAPIRAALSRVGSGFLWIVAAYAAATAVAAVPWGLLIPRARRPSWGAVVTSRFAASGVNALLPFFGLGEAGRLLWMPRPAWSSGTAAIVVDRLLFLVAGALLLIGGVGSARWSFPALPAALDLGGALVALVIVAGALAVAWLAAHGRIARRVAGLTRRLGLRRRAPDLTSAGAAPAPSGPEGQAWDEALRELLTGPKRALVAGLAVHVVARVLFAFEIYAGLRLLGLASGWRETLIFASVPIALSVVGTFIPGQIGIQEAVQALVATALGIGPAAGLALVLLQRARQLLFVPLSGVLMALVPRHRERTAGA
jgi:uncharacterized membrane protein YbhN (UPF0104 family)